MICWTKAFFKRLLTRLLLSERRSELRPLVLKQKAINWNFQNPLFPLLSSLESDWNLPLSLEYPFRVGIPVYFPRNLPSFVFPQPNTGAVEKKTDCIWHIVRLSCLKAFFLTYRERVSNRVHGNHSQVSGWSCLTELPSMAHHHAWIRCAWIFTAKDSLFLLIAFGKWDCCSRPRESCFASSQREDVLCVAMVRGFCALCSVSVPSMLISAPRLHFHEMVGRVWRDVRTMVRAETVECVDNVSYNLTTKNAWVFDRSRAVWTVMVLLCFFAAYTYGHQVTDEGTVKTGLDKWQRTYHSSFLFQA